MPSTQAGQFISITTLLGVDVLLLRSFTGQEGISQLFRFRLEMVSEKHPIRFESIIGQNVTVNMTLSDGSTRYFNGFVSEFTQTGQDSQFTYYHAEVVPRLWFLSQTSDCRIFQNKMVRKSSRRFFKSLDFVTLRVHSRAPMSRVKSMVQYHETDFNFISRLMEQAGISYFFEHERGKHTFVMADNPTAHPVYLSRLWCRTSLEMAGAQVAMWSPVWQSSRSGGRENMR